VPGAADTKSALAGKSTTTKRQWAISASRLACNRRNVIGIRIRSAIAHRQKFNDSGSTVPASARPTTKFPDQNSAEGLRRT
jgi:hypothetical protein